MWGNPEGFCGPIPNAPILTIIRLAVESDLMLTRQGCKRRSKDPSLKRPGVAPVAPE